MGSDKCPYQEGSAVYKARTLNAIFNPTQMYDDIKICNNTGVYKTNNNGNTQGLFGGENDYLKNLKPNDNNVVLSLNEINVYPNPTDVRIYCPGCFSGGIALRWYHMDAYGINGSKGRHMMPLPNRGGGRCVAVFPGVGFGGYISGPSLIAINPFAFTVPLLARLPETGTPLTQSVIEHMNRTLPKGYEYAVRTGKLDRMEPHLAAYYDKLRFIISGDLGSWERVKEIWRFNRGEYDHLRDAYLATLPKKS